jgi:hypothetical protein
MISMMTTNAITPIAISQITMQPRSNSVGAG